VIGKIGADDFLLERGISPVQGVLVNGREIPIPGIQGNRGDAIAARDEESFGFAAGLEIAASVQIRIAEITELLVCAARTRAGVTVSPWITESSNS